MTQETVPIPKIATRAIALVRVELIKTIAEAAELVGVSLEEGWQITENGTEFVKPDRPEKSDDS